MHPISTSARVLVTVTNFWFHWTVSGSIAEIDHYISHYRRILLLIPRHHPSHLYHVRLLGAAYDNRYLQSRQKKDLDNSILSYTEAILIAPLRNTDQCIVQTFFFLADGLLKRMDDFHESSDAQHCAAYFRYLQSHPPESFGIPCDDFKASFMSALAHQLNGGVGDVSQAIDEMTVQFHELLASNNPSRFLLTAIEALISINHLTCKQPLSPEDTEKVLECLREATKRDDSHGVVFHLAQFLALRFAKTCSVDDYSEAMALLDTIVVSESNRDRPGPYLEPAAGVSQSLAWNRFLHKANPEYAEEAIFRCRAFLRISSTDDAHRREVAEDLEKLMKLRSSLFGVTDGLQEARPHNTEDTDVPSFSHLVESLLATSTTDENRWWEGEERRGHFSALESVARTRDMVEIGEAMKYCELLLASIPSSNFYKFYPAIALGKVLLHAFTCTNKIEFLNKSVDTFRSIPQLIANKGHQLSAMQYLLYALSIRVNLLRNTKDFDELMQLHSVASRDTNTSARARFWMTYSWAQNARRNRHDSTSTAYEIAISLMEETLLFAPTLETQHFHLVSLSEYYEKLPVDIASYEIARGQRTRAIQALERGRGLLWSEMRGLRTSIDQLAVNSDLAQEFTMLNKELEAVIIPISPGIVMDDDGDPEHAEEMDHFGRLVVRHRKLLEKRNELVLQIQAMPGLEGFMKAPSFDTLRSAAAHGPVVIINHSEWRSDILIVLHDAHPSLITTTDKFYDDAIELRNRLLRTRQQYPLDSRQYQHALRSVLMSLYELVGQPVIKELRRLKIPEQSRIWWCPTSVFCSLPLHAMGPIPSNDSNPCYFSDLYISSYTPTLSALIESRKPSKSLSDKPSVLLVANLDDAMKEAWPEIWFIKGLDMKVTTLLGKMANPSDVLEGLQDNQFAHFVCHGNLVAEKPFDAFFSLHDGNRLTIHDVVRSRLPNAEFAFLSACHTAELTEGSIADEGLHLAAAVQYCGFRSVVGTMWAMADQDGGDLTKRFYKLKFSSGEPGVPYHERSARSLRDAVRSLRKKKRLPLEQWVNFVHYGA